VDSRSHYGRMIDAAAAESGGSNSTWIVAVLSILGTLAVAILTQWLTARRERERWQREREQDDLRWRRELDREAERHNRERRRDQEHWEQEQRREEQRHDREQRERLARWARENDARLYQERLTAYTRLLAAGQAFVTAVEVGHPLRTDHVQWFQIPGIMNDFDETIRALLAELQTAREKILVIGSMEVNEVSLEIQAVCSALRTRGVTLQQGDPAALEEISRIRDLMESLHKEVRRDIGSDPLGATDRGR
jgi:hypothetical protein